MVQVLERRIRLHTSHDGVEGSALIGVFDEDGHPLGDEFSWEEGHYLGADRDELQIGHTQLGEGQLTSKPTRRAPSKLSSRWYLIMILEPNRR